MGLFASILFGTLCASWTCMSISFTKLGKFSFTIFSNRFPFFCSLSSSSGTPMIQMLEPLKLSHKLLTLSLFYSSCYSFLNKDFIYLLLERGEGREKETKMSTCGCLSYAGATGDLARSPGLCPDWELNWQPFGSQAGTQSTEPHQPGLSCCSDWFFFASLCPISLIWFSASSTLLLFSCKLFLISISVSFNSVWTF